MKTKFHLARNGQVIVFTQLFFFVSSSEFYPASPMDKLLSAVLISSE